MSGRFLFDPRTSSINQSSPMCSDSVIRAGNVCDKDAVTGSTTGSCRLTEPRRPAMHLSECRWPQLGVAVTALLTSTKLPYIRPRDWWTTVARFNSRYETFISVCDRSPRSTQPGHPFMGRCNEYQRKGGDALRLGSKGRYGSCVGGRKLKLYDPIVIHGPYLSTLEIHRNRHKHSQIYKTNEPPCHMIDWLRKA